MTTTIYDIFQLRKSGEFETAYKAACERYAVTRAYYTNLCMFWCALDFARYLVQSDRIAECPHVIGRMVDAYRYISDRDGIARATANQFLTQYYNSMSAVNSVC